MKPLCFALDSSDDVPMPKALHSDDWQCHRAGETLHLKRSYLDSLDWRLLKNDLCLVADHHQQGSCRLRLFALPEYTLLVDTESPRLPDFVNTLPSGDLSARLTPILHPRALLPQVRLSVTRHPMIIKDARERTVAHLDLEICIPDMRGVKEGSLIDRRLWLTPGKRPGRKIRAIIAMLSDYGIPVSIEIIPLNKLIAILHVDASRFDSKPSLKFQPDDRADKIIKQVLRFFLSVMEINRPVIISDIDGECLHDYRVAVRRSRSLLGQMREVIDRKRLQRAKKFFSRLSEITATQRDLDVMLLNFALYRSLLPAQNRHDLDPAYTYLIEQRGHETACTALFLESQEYRRWVEGWSNYLDAPVPQRTTFSNAIKPIVVVARSRIWKAYKRVVTQGRAIDDASPPEALHDLRKKCKSLRYLIESFVALFPKDKCKHALAVLKNLQDNLGAFQDFHVHIELLGKTREGLKENGYLDDVTDSAIAQVVQVLNAKMDARRYSFYKRYKAFSSERNQRLFRQLFKP